MKFKKARLQRHIDTVQNQNPHPSRHRGECGMWMYYGNIKKSPKVMLYDYVQE